MAFTGFPNTPAGYTTAGGVYETPYEYMEYTEYYVPTVQNRGRQRPVIYIAAPLPAASPYGNTGFPGAFPTPYGGGGASGFRMF